VAVQPLKATIAPNESYSAGAKTATSSSNTATHRRLHDSSDTLGASFSPALAVMREPGVARDEIFLIWRALLSFALPLPPSVFQFPLYFTVYLTPSVARLEHLDKGGANSEAFHAFRRACGFYSLSLPFAAWWSPQGSDYTGACVRSFRMPPSWSKHQRVRRAQMGGVEVSAGRHKSDCRSTAGEDQEGLRLCGLEGRRSMQ